ncbi:MAG: SDR family oxidoreductase, partial [Myxococcales bacterium]|nr:SDR family oxidoreductase [Myxococcales bacterium]
RIEAVQPADVAETFLVNAVGPLRVAQVFWPRLDSGSKLVCLTSLMGSIADNGGGGRYGYRMSKAALNMLVRNLGHETEPKGVVVLAIHPGWVRTDMGGPNAPLSIDESVDAMVATIDEVGMERNGAFVDRNGEPLPW